MFGLVSHRAVDRLQARVTAAEAEARFQRENADGHRRRASRLVRREFETQTRYLREIRELRELLDAAQRERDEAEAEVERQTFNVELFRANIDAAERERQEALAELDQARRTVVLPAHGEVSYSVTLRPDDQITRVTDALDKRDDIANTFLRSRPD